MKHTGILLIALLCAWRLSAQSLSPEVFSSFGGQGANATAQLTYTGGEPLYETVGNDQSVLTQGFNQTLTIIAVTKISDLPTLYEINAFPNPTPNFVTVHTTATKPLHLQIFDMQGKLLLSTPLNGSQDVDMSAYTTGNYLLHLSDGAQTVKTFQIQKIR